MLIGIAAFVLAVSAYVYREGIPRDILARLANPFGLWGPTTSIKTITDGSVSANKESTELADGAGRAQNRDAGASYISSVPSRKAKEEVLVESDEEDDPSTPTAPVQIELSVAYSEPDAKTESQRKGKGKTTILEPDDDDLRVPMFPALNSVQRASRPVMAPPQPPSLAVPGLMAPPPLPVPKLEAGPALSMPPPPIPLRKPAGVGPSAAANARNSQYSRPVQSSPSSSLAVPPSLSVPQQRSSLQLPPTHSQPPPKPRQKVILTPGHSPLDWANHQRALPFVPLRRITPSELAEHGARKNSSKTYWTVLEGRVYDMTPYLPYHPGGEKELLRVAGKDGTKLFNLTHSWVNWDNMLRGCEVGILVSGNELPQAGKENGPKSDDGDLESMD